MKRKFPLLIAALVGILAMCSLSSCNSGKLWGSDPTEEVSTQMVDSIVKAEVQNIVNPVFSSVDDVLTYMDVMIGIEQTDSVWKAMPHDVIIKITNVLLNRDHVASKKAIVLEYLAHPDIYPYLKDAENNTDTSPTSTESKDVVANIQLVNEGKTTVTEAPPTRVEEQPANYKDTVIDGKHAIIKQ